MTVIPTASFPMTRGRRAALVVGVPVCLALVAATGLSLVANVGEGRYPVGFAIPASTRSLKLTVAAGQLTVGPSASGRATLDGTARYSLVRSELTVSSAGGATSVGYRCPVPVGDCELDATVSVPAALPVSASTEGGDIRVNGTAGPVTVATSGGNVAADRTAGPLRLDTGGGDISATAVSSPTVALSTAGGNVKATGVGSPSVTATTDGGNIEIDFTSVPRDVQVNTSGGNVTLVLPPGSASYRVSAYTAGGGVTDTVPRSDSSANMITATSGGGHITIERG